MSTEATSVAVAIAYLLVVCAAVYGWVMNVVILATSVNDPISGLTLLRAIGVFLAPLGAVLGFV